MRVAITVVSTADANPSAHFLAPDHPLVFFDMTRPQTS
jgi:hypothetical protein